MTVLKPLFFLLSSALFSFVNFPSQNFRMYLELLQRDVLFGDLALKNAIQKLHRYTWAASRGGCPNMLRAQRYGIITWQILTNDGALVSMNTAIVVVDVEIVKSCLAVQWQRHLSISTLEDISELHVKPSCFLPWHILDPNSPKDLARIGVSLAGK